MSTFIIAEAGANHNRSFKQALRLIDTAKEAGACAVKFQTYSSESLYAKNTADFAGYENINKLIKDIELPREWQQGLKEYCDSEGIEFISTPFDEKAVEELVGLGVSRLKISGFESTDFRFVEMVASTQLPLIISLGIGFNSLLSHEGSDLSRLFSIINKYQNPVTLLQCNNAYPTPLRDSGLSKLKTILENLEIVSGPSSCSIGLSDHTRSIHVPSIAVALGATTIEKHFTLSRRLPGPDHLFALEPTELKNMVDLIRETEEALTPLNDLYSESEKPFINARRSVVTTTNLETGSLLGPNNITTKRPFVAGNIPASDYHKVMGKKIRVDVGVDECLRLSDLDGNHESYAQMWSGG
jgi:sialic acid synthase SpsE